eukprot:251917_1
MRCPLRWHPHLRQEVRLLLRPRPARHLRPQPGHQGLDRGAAAHEGGRQVGGVHPLQPGLRRAGPPPDHPRLCHPRLRDGADEGQGQGQGWRRRHQEARDRSWPRLR